MLIIFRVKPDYASKASLAEALLSNGFSLTDHPTALLQMRPLTDKGKKQAAVAKGWYDKDIGVPANKILVTSGARRASETLQVLW